VRAYPADQHVIAVEQQVVGGNGGGYCGRCLLHKRGGIGGGDVLQYHPELGNTLHQWHQDGVEKHFFAVKNIDITMGDFAMNK
jgi:hypothetical protein